MQLKFRIGDLASYAARRANEDQVVAGYFREAGNEDTVGTSAQCSCGKTREAYGLTPTGNVLVGCRDGGTFIHVVTLPLSAAGCIWPGVTDRSEATFDFNSAVAYSLARGLDVPIRFRGRTPGPILTGGGTVYRSGSSVPVYPSSESAREGESAWAPSPELISEMYAARNRRFDYRIEAARAAEAVPVPEPTEEYVEVRPVTRPQFRKRGVA